MPAESFKSWSCALGYECQTMVGRFNPETDICPNHNRCRGVKDAFERTWVNDRIPYPELLPYPGYIPPGCPLPYERFIEVEYDCWVMVVKDHCYEALDAGYHKPSWTRLGIAARRCY